jgi:hypothetical protein
VKLSSLFVDDLIINFLQNLIWNKSNQSFATFWENNVSVAKN